MPRIVEVGKTSLPGKILNLLLPDDETLAFWKATADDPDEFAARVARFSRALTNGVAAKAVKSPVRRPQGTGTSVQSTRPTVPGKLLIMPPLPKKPVKSPAQPGSIAEIKARNSGKNAEEK